MKPVHGLTIQSNFSPEPYTARKLDIGLAKIMGNQIPGARHSVTITGLAHGKYLFRVGDAARNWLNPWQMLNTGQQTRAARAFRIAKGTAKTASKIVHSFRLVE
jgi:hypothetical protein